VEAVKSTAFVFKVELSEVLRRNTANWITRLVTGKKKQGFMDFGAENGLKNVGMQQNGLCSESEGDHTIGGPEVTYRCAEAYRTDILLNYIFTYQLPNSLQLKS
jgi:hypothetical protein